MPLRKRRDVPEPVRRFVRKQAQLAAAISDALDAKGQTDGERWTQRRLAQEMGKKESAISRLLSVTQPDEPQDHETTDEAVERLLRGTGNPTLKTIVEVEAALGHELFVVPQFHRPQIAEYDMAPGTFDAAFAGARQRPLSADPSFLDVDPVVVPRAGSLTIGRQRTP